MAKRALLATSVLATAFLLPLPAAEVSFFPLEVGNQWIYRATGAAGGGHVVIQVLEAAQIGGKEYFLVAGWEEGPAWLRLSEEGTLLSYSRESGREAVWARFSAAEGDAYETAMNPCSPTARIEQRGGRIDTPAGAFTDVLLVGYPVSNCADAGLVSDAFAPFAGLVQRTMTTIAGPRTLSLIYARIGERTVVSQPEVTFSLSLDRAVYSPRLEVPALTARLTLRVRQAEPLELTFPSAQRFDLALRNEQGETVYLWSERRAFALLYGTERVGPGEKNWLVEIPLQTKEGNQLPPGKYTAEGWLTTEGSRRYAASVGFEIAAWRQGRQERPGGIR